MHIKRLKTRLKRFLVRLPYRLNLMLHKRPPLSQIIDVLLVSLEEIAEKIFQSNISKRVTHTKIWKKFQRLRKGYRRLAFASLLVLIIFIPLAVYQLRKPEKTEAWHDESFKYRQKIVITDTANIQANYQYVFTLDTASLISQSKMRSDCADLRLLNQDGTPFIHPYYLLSCNSSVTNIYIKFTSTQSQNLVLYLYYGNPALTTKLYTATQVFDFFDDFDGDAIDTSKWTITNSTGWSVTNGELKGTSTTGRLTSTTTYSDGVIQEVGYRYVSQPGNGVMAGGFFLTTANGFGYLEANGGDFYRNNGSWTGMAGVDADGLNQRLTITAKSPTAVDLSVVNLSSGATIQSVSNVNNAISNEPIVIGQRYDNNNPGQTYEAYWDWILIRKYSASNPTITLSSQETAPEPVAHWKFDEGYTHEIVQPLTKNEQVIDLITVTYSASGTDQPGDNSLGYIHYDASKYSDAVVYLDIVYADSYLGGSCSLWDYAELYAADGSVVSGSKTTQQCTTSVVRSRSGAFTLTTGDYHVRFTGSGNTMAVKAARLIVVQNASEKLTATEAQIRIGNRDRKLTSTATLINDPIHYYYDSSKFSPVPTAYFEALLHNSQPTIEQQIPIFNSYLSTTAANTPSDNSAGIIHFDASKYSNATVYLEVVFSDSYLGGSCSLWDYADLYTTAGVVVNGSRTSQMCTTSTGRSRSSAFSLPTGDYTVRFTARSSTMVIRSAKLIVIQSASDKITGTEAQIEVGGTQSDFTNTNYAVLTNPSYYLYDHDRFTPSIESSGDASFSASIKIADAADTVHAALYNKTHGTLVSEVSYTGSSSWTIQTATNIDASSEWDTVNDDEYEVYVKCTDNNGGGCSGSIQNAKIILDQYDGGGISATELVHQQVNRALTDADATYTSQYTYARHNPELEPTQVNLAGGVFAYYHEAVMKTSAGTGYACINNCYSSSIISTTNASYERVRSSDFTVDVPTWPTTTSAATLDTYIKNGATNTTTVSTSRIIIQATNLVTSGAESRAELYNVTDNTSVAGSEVVSTSPDWTNIRSNAITLASGKTYAIRMKSNIENIPSYLMTARLILDQSDTENGIIKNEAVVPITNSVLTDGDGYTSQLHYFLFDSATYDYIPYYSLFDSFFETTMKTSAGTGYAQLYNTSDSAAITNAAVSTANTDYERARGGSLISFLPRASKTIDTQISGSGGTASIANSWLIYQNTRTVPHAIHDSSKFNAYANLNNDPTWKTGNDCIQGSCLLLDGVNDFIVTPDTIQTDFSVSNSFTISGWFKVTKLTASNQTLLTKYNASTGTDGGYKVYIDTVGKLTAGLDTNSTSFPEDSVTSVNSFSDQKWHHFAVVKNGTSRIDLYVDGKLEGSDVSLAASGTYANTDSMVMGMEADAATNPFNGSLDEIKIYPEARSVNQILADYSIAMGNSSPLPGDSLSLHWKMNETQADTCDGANDTCDDSGFDNHGNWQGNAAAASGKLGQAVSFDGTGDSVLLSSPSHLISNWLNSSWSKRKPVVVTNSTSSDFTNFQVKVTVAYDSDMQSDFDDLRFTNTNGDLLDYWIQSKTDSVTATVWVEVDTFMANSNTTIYMYYGNPAATSESNGTNTFVFFDDFNDNDSSSSWETHVRSYNSGTNNMSTAETGSEQVISGSAGAADYGKGLRTIQTFSTPLVYEIDRVSFSKTGTGARWWGYAHMYQDDQNWVSYGGGVGYSNGNNRTGRLSYVSNSRTVNENLGTADDYGSHRFKIVHDGTNAVFYFDDSQAGTLAASTFTSVRVGTASWVRGASDTITARFDNARIRKYATTEPTVSVSTEESTSTTPAHFTTTVWIKGLTLDASNRVIMARGNSNAYNWALYADGANPGKLAFTSDSVNIGTSQTVLNTNQWHFVAMTVDGTKTRLFIDGRFDAETNNNGLLTGLNALAVGADPDGTDGWNGLIDEVRIYNKSLTEFEIRKLYNQEAAPTAFYDLNENTGSVAYDRSGNGYTLTASGTTWKPGKYGSGLHFDGAASKLTRADTGALDFTSSQSFTLETWFKHPTAVTGTDVIMAKGNSSTGADGGYKVYMNSNGTITCGIDTDNASFPEDSATSVANYADNKWHHISCIKNGTTSLDLYIDGIKVGSDAAITNAGTYANTDAFFVGVDGDGASNFWEGQLDDIKIYDFAVSIKQITLDRNASHPIGGSPVGSASIHYGFDEAAGTTANNKGNNGSALNGTISNGAWSLEGKVGGAVMFASNTTVTTTISDPGYTHAISVWLYPTTSIASKTVMTNLTTDGSSRPVYGGCTGATLPLDQWTHIVAASNDSSSCKIYQNGKLTANGATGVSFGANLSLGASSFTGQMDEFKLYTAALTTEEVLIDFNRGTAAVMGAISTASDGKTADNSAARAYCVPGDTSSCSAPVGHWKLDENTGTAAADAGGNNVNGTLNGPTWTTGKQGSGLLLDGNDDVTLGDVFDFTSSFTMSGWVKFADTSQEMYIINKNGGPGARDWSLGNEGGNSLMFRISPDGTNAVTRYANFTVSSNVWVHLTGVYNASSQTLDIYVNGQLANGTLSGTIPASIASTNNNAYLGRRESNNAYLNGALDDIRVYNYARTPAQIAWDYDKGAPLAWYKFDECQGTTTYNSALNSNGRAAGMNGTISAASLVNTGVGSCDSGVTTDMWNDGMTGKYNGSLGFDGSDDVVTINDAADLRFDAATQDFAVFTWVKRSAADAVHTVVSKLDAADDGYQLLINANNTVTCSVDAIDIISTSTIDTNWHHVGCVIDRDGNGQVYIDGKPDGAAVAINAEAMATTVNLTLGSSLNGLLDDMQIFNYAPTQAQIRTFMNQGAVLFQ